MNSLKRNTTPGHLLRWLLLALLVGAFGAARPAQAQVTATTPQLTGNCVRATFTNTNKDCKDILVGLATYCIPKDDIYSGGSNHDFLNRQVLFCYVQRTVKAGKCVTLTVSVPCDKQCPKFQADAFTGCVITQFHDNDYGSRFLTAIIANSPHCGDDDGHHGDDGHHDNDDHHDNDGHHGDDGHHDND